MDTKKNFMQSKIPCNPLLKNRFPKLTLTKNKKPNDYGKQCGEPQQPTKLSTPERTSDSVFKNARPGMGIVKKIPAIINTTILSSDSFKLDNSAPRKLSHSSLISDDESDKENDKVVTKSNVLLKSDTDETNCSNFKIIKNTCNESVAKDLDTTVSQSQSIADEIVSNVLSSKVDSLHIAGSSNFRHSIADRDTVVDEDDAVESEESVICVSDSSDADEEYYPVSSINTQRISIASSVMRRVDNFFENIPIGDCSSNTNGDQSLVESSFSVPQKEHVEPLYISATSTESSADPIPEQSIPIVTVHRNNVSTNEQSGLTESPEVSLEEPGFLDNPVVQSSLKEDANINNSANTDSSKSEDSLTQESSVEEKELGSNAVVESQPVSRKTSNTSESINISAHIKINIQISNLSVTARSEPSSSDTDTPKSGNKKTNSKLNLNSPVSSTSNQKVIKEPSTPHPDVNDIDEEAQSLLDKLYGEQWKTPEILKHCSTTKKKPQRINPVTFPTNDEFLSFKRNIQQDLESTRVGGGNKTPAVERDVIKSKEVLSPLFMKPTIGARRAKVIDRPQRKAAVRPVNFAELCDSDTSSDEYQIDDNGSSDEEEPIKLPKCIEKTRKNFSKDKIVYLDLSKDTISFVEDHSGPEADESILLELHKKNLDQFKAPIKATMPLTPKDLSSTAKKVVTKRKLFTPRYDDIVIDNIRATERSPPKRDLFGCDPDCQDEVIIKGALPKFFMAKRLLDKYDSPAKPDAPKSNAPKNTETQLTETTPTKIQTSVSSQVPGTTKCKTPVGKLQKTPNNKFGFLQSLDVSIAKMMCHPDALYYKENYKTKKTDLMDRLYDLYNLKVFNNQLIIKLTWNKKLLTTAGRCMNKKTGGERISRVELSEKVLTSADRLRCTLIHELCHAAAWVFDEENGHGASWKRWAKKCNTVFPELPKINVCHQYDIEYKYTYKCKLCDAKSYAHSKSKKVENIRCSYCHGSIEIFLNKKDKEGNTVHTPVRGASGFAKFVKEKYNTLKKPALSHADVMRLLSTEFGTLSVDEKKKY